MDTTKILENDPDYQRFTRVCDEQHYAAMEATSPVPLTWDANGWRCETWAEAAEAWFRTNNAWMLRTFGYGYERPAVSK